MDGVKWASCIEYPTFKVCLKNGVFVEDIGSEPEISKLSGSFSDVNTEHFQMKWNPGPQKQRNSQEN